MFPALHIPYYVCYVHCSYFITNRSTAGQVVAHDQKHLGSGMDSIYVPVEGMYYLW